MDDLKKSSKNARQYKVFDARAARQDVPQTSMDRALMKKSEPANLEAMDEPLRKHARSEAATWQGRPLTDATHQQQLEQNAAINEFGHRMPKTEAEKKAYEDYVKDQRTDAAAFHLRGLKAAQGAGDREASEKHAIMYALHCKALGHEPVGAPHASIVARMENHPDKLYRFKAHKGDLYALPNGDKGAQDPTKADK